MSDGTLTGAGGYLTNTGTVSTNAVATLGAGTLANSPGAFTVTAVPEVPDLQILDLTITTVVKEFSPFGLDVTLHNNGSVAAPVPYLFYYLSTDSTVDPYDHVISQYLDPIGPGETVVIRNSFVDSLHVGGPYYIFAIPSPNPSNNFASTQFTVESTGLSEPKSTLPVWEGGTATITHAFLWSYDSDGIRFGDPASIVYVVENPEHGSLLKDGIATNSFTQADIDKGLIEYVHSGDGSTADGFTFTVSDPVGNHLTEDFRMAILDTADPVVETNVALPASIGGAALLEGSLGTVSLGNDPEQMRYTVIESPHHGMLYNKGIATTSFSQADIDNHFVQYRENGDAVAQDSFSFVVSNSAGAVSAPQTFQIAVSNAYSNHSAEADRPWALEVWRDGTLQDGLVLPGATAEEMVQRFMAAASQVASATSDRTTIIYETGTFDPTGNTAPAAAAHSMSFVFQDQSRLSLVGVSHDFTFLVA